MSKHFGFLESAFGMSVIGADDSSNWETSITYARDPICVIVRYSVEFDRAEVELVQLVDHEVPKVPIFVHAETPTNRALLDLLLEIRAPVEAEQLAALTGLGNSAVQKALNFQAVALQTYGRDFLAGETSVFADIDRLIKARVAKNPQVLRIHVPEGTSQAEIDKTVARARKLDPQVPVEVGFYRRPSSTRKPSVKWPWQKRSGPDSKG